MPKMKTHKGTKKVLNVRNSGTIGIGCPGSRHNTGKKNGTVVYKQSNGNHKTAKDSGKQIRQRRRKGILAKGDTARLRDFI